MVYVMVNYLVYGIMVLMAYMNGIRYIMVYGRTIYENYTHIYIYSILF